MMSDETMEYTDWDIDVAKRVACAVLSYQAGMSYESLWEQYADPGKEAGPFWLKVAKQIREDLRLQPNEQNQ